MPLTKIEVLGYRGFKTREVIECAVPNGKDGSGLTILTGPNNSGKSSILECLRARSGNPSVSFTAGTRNTVAESVEIKYIVDGQEECRQSVAKGSSETTFTSKVPQFSIFVLPLRRAFSTFFHRGDFSREQYTASTSLPPQRASTLANFEYRLFNILKNPEPFNTLLAEALGFKAEWTIDQADSGQYFLKFFNGQHSHSSDGVGEGIISVFAIVDSLYDSSAGNMIVIDEPELSLHPSLQKRVAKLIRRYSRD